MQGIIRIQLIYQGPTIRPENEREWVNGARRLGARMDTDDAPRSHRLRQSLNARIRPFVLGVWRKAKPIARLFDALAYAVGKRIKRLDADRRTTGWIFLEAAGLTCPRIFGPPEA